MMKKGLCILLALCLSLGMRVTAAAEREHVRAKLENGILCVEWDTCGGCGTVTAYQYGWVVYTRYVNGCDGYCEFPYCYGDAGTYEVAVRIGSHCARVGVSAGAGCAEECVPTPTPYADEAGWQAWSAPQPTRNAGASSSGAADEVARQVNAERARYGLGALTVSGELTRAAETRARELAVKFSHTRPDGSAWSSVSSDAKGENIAMGYATADKVMAAWMTSDGHRANILRESFGSIGVCAYREGNVWYWVQLFGR